MHVGRKEIENGRGERRGRGGKRGEERKNERISNMIPIDQIKTPMAIPPFNSCAEE